MITVSTVIVCTLIHACIYIYIAIRVNCVIYLTIFVRMYVLKICIEKNCYYGKGYQL